MVQGPVCDKCKNRIWCTTCHGLTRVSYKQYGTKKEYDRRIRKGALAGLLEERYTSIPQTTITLGLFFLCTGFQYVWLQLSKTPEECYENLKCETLGRQYNVKNWNAVLSNLVYFIVGSFLYIFIRCKACEDENKWRRGQIKSREELDNCSEDMKRSMTEAYLKERLCHNKAKAGLAVNACLSLIFEGLLSGLYHACPTPTNTQFDYIGITMVSISFFIMVWCKRHPFALSSGAYAVFFAYVCIVITLDNVGFVTGKKGFSKAAWCSTLAGWFVLVPRYFMLLHYGIPNVIPNCQECKNACPKVQEVRQEMPDSCHRACFCRTCRKLLMGMPMFLLWFFGAVALSYLCYTEENISRAIMETSIMFLALYTMKHLTWLFCSASCRHCCWRHCESCLDDAQSGRQQRGNGDAECGEDGGSTTEEEERSNEEKEEREVEKRRKEAEKNFPSRETEWWWAHWEVLKKTCCLIPHPVFFLILLTLAFGGAGGYFFLHDVYNTKKSLHDSSEMNEKCLLFGFFDNHDVWHLFSGLALGSYILTSVMLDEVKELEEVF